LNKTSGISVVEDFPTLSSSSSSSLPMNQHNATNFLAIVRKSIRKESSEVLSEVQVDAMKSLARQGWYTSSSLLISNQQQQEQEQHKGGHVVQSLSLPPASSEVELVDDRGHATVVSPTASSAPTLLAAVQPAPKYLFQHTITDKIREKYRKKWLDIARHVTIRDQKARDAAAVLATERSAAVSLYNGKSGVPSWHAALSPAVDVSNRQLCEVYIADESAVTSSVDKSSKNKQLTSPAATNTDGDTNTWWISVCSGDVKRIQEMMERGFEWSALTYGTVLLIIPLVAY
jgi:hypothetical protein